MQKTWIALIIAAAANNVVAAPWVDTEDPTLRASIELLAQSNIIKTPINTYPLNWVNIAEELNHADLSKLSDGEQLALAQVRSAMSVARRNLAAVKVAMSDSDYITQDFGESYQAGKTLSISKELQGNGVAVKTQVNFVGDRYGTDSQSKNYDGSFVAWNLGNWVLSADQISSWWGPGNSNALAQSNNARPFPALRFSRHYAAAFDTPWLSWIGPWHFTTYLGKQEHSAIPANPLLWGARVDFRPWPNLEIGLSRSTQWGGEDRSQSISTFGHLILGKDNTNGGPETEPGNQIAGFDFRYNMSGWGLPLSLYGEMQGEDEAGYLPTAKFYLIGSQSFFTGTRGLYKGFIEFTNTTNSCFNDNVNCTYEHHIYQNGYRRYGKSMGSTYDSGSKVLTAGLAYQTYSGMAWQVKLSTMDLNTDGSNRLIVHPLSPTHSKRNQLELSYQQGLFAGLLKLNAIYYRQKDVDSSDSHNDSQWQASYELRF